MPFSCHPPLADSCSSSSSRDNPLSILLLAGMNHHLRRPLFLKHCLVFSEVNVTLSGSLARACTILAVVAVVPGGSELASGLMDVVLRELWK